MVDALVRAGVTHLTVTVNAVDPSIGARIYRWVRKRRRGPPRREEGAILLIARQLDGITRAVAAGLTVKVNSVVLPERQRRASASQWRGESGSRAPRS